MKKYKIIHGMRKTREYKLWQNIRQRCTNSNHHSYKYYGGRGIILDSYFDVFINFYNYIITIENYDIWKSDKTYSLDRIDNNKGYIKDNLRFTTKSKQCENTNTYKNSTSGYRCVYYNKCANKWESSLSINKKRVFIGKFDTAKEAAIAYNNFVINNNLDRYLNII